MSVTNAKLLSEIRREAVPLTGGASDTDALMRLIGDARFVLIGEASHGTQEFYAMRAELTKRLIVEHGIAAVAAEADWPDAYRINRYVRGDPSIRDADDALRDFQRFPTWMWRNTVMRDFIEWLRRHNDRISDPSRKVGFYGLDLYSLEASMEAVVTYLDKVDPDAARRARAHYNCLDHRYANKPQAYGYATLLGVTRDCERDVIEQLTDMQRHKFDYIAKDGYAAGEAFYCALQNALVVRHAEKYYKMMFQGRVLCWNLRDRHMATTLFDLADHLHDQRGAPPRIAVWAHNSHIGDARATEMSERGEWNIGCLVREAYGSEAFLIGFSTHSGTVLAASAWDRPGKVKQVLESLPESYERIFHDIGQPRFLLPLRGNGQLFNHLRLSRLQRAIGVIYLPQSERDSHYFFARLPDQFDALIHIDETSALRPLDPVAERPRERVFETYPTGL